MIIQFVTLIEIQDMIFKELVEKYYNEAYITNEIKKMSLFVLKI